MHDGYDLELTESRHPVIEKTAGESYISNDIILNDSNQQIIIPGPDPI